MCRFGATATGSPIKPRKSTCVCSSFTSRSPRNKSNSGLCFCVPDPAQIPRAGHARADENRGRRFHGRLLLASGWNSVPSGTQIASSVPFLYEINTLLEWTTARSVLPMSAWFSLEEIHRVLYHALYRVPRFHLSRRRRKPRSGTTSTTARCRGLRGRSCSTAACSSRE